MKDSRIETIENELSSLPRGTLVYKNIKGQQQPYLQWSENGKSVSKYIKLQDREVILKQMKRKSELLNELKVLKKELSASHSILSLKSVPAFEAKNNSSPVLYLKWSDETIAEVDREYNVHFFLPSYNSTVALYTKGKEVWSRIEFEAFLEDRLVSRSRRDIEKIIHKLGFSRYDVIQLAAATHAINSRDLLWVTDKKDEKFSDAVTQVFSMIFGRKLDAQGDSVDTPEGYNIKRYGVYNGKYGIYKKRLSPLATDVESEVAVYNLAALMGIPCCPAIRVDADTVFSEFLYDFNTEHIVHFRRFFELERSENEYYNLLSVRPQYQADYIKMIALDFVTRQDDRHLSNIAVKITDAGESFYPLYDNGRSLFYEDTPQTVEMALKDIPGFSTSFGPSGTYYDFICDIKASGVTFSKLMNLDISRARVRKLLDECGFSGYRLDGAEEWIMRCLEILKDE